MSFFNHLREYFRALIFERRLRACRTIADRRRAISGQKQLVIVFNRRPEVISKQQVKRLIRDGVYKKGVSAADIERRAIYVAL